jgi:hypothetical protein
MKNIYFLLALLLHATVLLGQDKHDHIWLFGYPPNIEQDSFGGTRLDFNVEPLEIGFFETPYRICQSGVVSDSSGRLALYSNGCDVRNRHHQVMQNGAGINSGQTHDTYCVNGCYPLNQGILALPHPGVDGQYCLFHLWRGGDAAIRDFLYSVIDVAADNDSGVVLQKNVLLFQDALADQLTAVRHANGRDWWILVPKAGGNRYFRFLFSPAGVEGPWGQDIGHPWLPWYWSGQVCFSPDGRKYIRMNPFNGLHVFDFDRCTGTLSNPLAIGFPEHVASSADSGGVSVSPNGRFLYVSFSTRVYQYDLYAASIAASRKTVAVYDGFLSPLPTTFYQHALGPDGKIYITASNSVNRLHVIHRPDEPGEACDLEQHGLRLAGLHAFAAPNIPHFRLWGEAGSPCDTLGLTGPVAAPEERRPPFGIRLFPNPAGEQAILLLEGAPPGPAWMGLYNAVGQLVRQASWPQAGRHEISLAGLPAGVYYAQIATADGQRRVLPLAKR